MTTGQMIAIDSLAVVLLGLVIYFSRATPKRVLAAGVGGLVEMAFAIGYDTVGDASGWWHYTTGSTAHMPVLIYPALWLWYGVGVTLIGWRVSRRFGWRGLIGFIGFMAVYGPVRDYAGIALTNGTIQVISSGIPPFVADVLLWASMNAVAQAVMWLVAGSPQSDPFAREPFRFTRYRTRRDV